MSRDDLNFLLLFFIPSSLARYISNPLGTMQYSSMTEVCPVILRVRHSKPHAWDRVYSPLVGNLHRLYDTSPNVTASSIHALQTDFTCLNQ